MRSRSDLHHYQEKAASFIREKKRCGLWLGLGLGKTVSTLTAVSDLFAEDKIKRVLIIAPLRVANSVWHAEAESWEHLKHLKMQLCTGTELKRRQSFKTSADIYVINRENIPWLVARSGKKWHFDCVIIDEASSFKNPSSKRFKALKHILPDTNYMILLTGTPAPNGIMDLWAQMYLIDSGKALGRSMYEYKNRYFISDHLKYIYTPRFGAEGLVQALMAPHIISMNSEDYLELPPSIHITEWVMLPNDKLRQYKQFEKKLIGEFGGKEIEASTAAVLANKLLQFSNGSMYDEDRVPRLIHNDKIDALESILETNVGEPILVAYNFQTDSVRIKEKFPFAKLLDSNPQTIEDWNCGRIPLLLAHPASCGHGLNLQKGGSIIVWFGLNWSLELYQQMNARLYRQGQPYPVRIIHIVTKGTIDERVMKVLHDKHAVQHNLLESLKI